MGTVITIDPGVKASGVALWSAEGTLIEGSYRTIQEVKLLLSELLKPSLLICEFPRIYPKAAQHKGDLNDLLNLSAVVGYIEGLFCCVEPRRIYPSEWKGQVPKVIMTERIKKALTPLELARVKSVGSKTHNVLDAVGIGLHHFERLGKP